MTRADTNHEGLHDESRCAQNTLRADRLCPKCGVNLIGRAITREEHYALLVVKCPNCDQVVPVQEYPALGEWPARWRAMSAIFWLLFLFVATSLSVALCGFTSYLQDSASYQLKSTIAKAHLQWFQTDRVASGTTEFGEVYNVSATPDSQIDIEWLDQQDGNSFIDEVGGLTQAIQWPDLGDLLRWMLTCLLVGAFWSAVFSHWKRRWLWLPAVAGGCLVWWSTTASFNYEWWDSNFYNYGNNWSPTAEMVAQSIIWPRLSLPLALIATVLLLIGITFGRPIARLTIRALLAPRLRGPFSFLWTCDGLEPPVPGASLRLRH